MSKRRTAVNWGIRIGCGLVVAALVGLVAVDRWRAHALGVNRERLQSSFGRVEAEILTGRSPADWQASRAIGSNGWQHIALMREAAEAGKGIWRSDGLPEPPLYSMWSAGQKLDSYANGDAGEEPAPTQAMLEEWLLETSRWLMATRGPRTLTASSGSCDRASRTLRGRPSTCLRGAIASA